MKTMIATTGSAVMFNPDDQTLKYVTSDRNGIDNVYLIGEKCNVKALGIDKDGKEVEKTFEAEPGDILVRFWRDDFPNQYILVKSDGWADNIKAYRKAEQKRKEEWAKNKADRTEGRFEALAAA